MGLLLLQLLVRVLVLLLRVVVLLTGWPLLSSYGSTRSSPQPSCGLEGCCCCRQSWPWVRLGVRPGACCWICLLLYRAAAAAASWHRWHFLLLLGLVLALLLLVVLLALLLVLVLLLVLEGLNCIRRHLVSGALWLWLRTLPSLTAGWAANIPGGSNCPSLLPGGCCSCCWRCCWSWWGCCCCCGRFSAVRVITSCCCCAADDDGVAALCCTVAVHPFVCLHTAGACVEQLYKVLLRVLQHSVQAKRVSSRLLLCCAGRGYC